MILHALISSDKQSLFATGLFYDLDLDVFPGTCRNEGLGDGVERALLLIHV
jgi:hypothetical protein